MRKIFNYFTCKIFDSLRTGLDAKPIYLSTKAGVLIDGVPALDIMEVPDSRERGIKPSETTATASKMNVKINNPNAEFSTLLYERMNSIGTLFWNEKIEVFGYAGTTEYKLFSGLIEEINSDPYETEYTITTSDVLKVMKSDIFSRELGDFWETFGGVKESLTEINSHRLPAGFTAHEKTDGDGEVIKYIEFNGHPIDCFLGMSQVLFSNPINAIGVSYLNTNYLDFLDINSINEVKTSLSDSIYGGFKFVWYDSIDNPFTFFKEQIFKACVIFPYITNDGRLGLKLHEQPLNSEGVESFNEDKIIELKSKVNSMSKYVNHIRVDYNRIISENEDKFNKSVYAIQSDALEKTGFLSPKGSPLNFQLEGINFGFADATRQSTLVQQLIDSYFARYSTSITNIAFTTPMIFAADLKVGDYISLSHNSLIEWGVEGQGTRGLTETIIDPGDPYARLDNDDHWSGFVINNNLGKDIEGLTFLNTLSEEITSALFVGNTLSCKTNHQDFTNWANAQ